MKHNLLSYALVALTSVLLSACASGSRYEMMVVPSDSELTAPAKFKNNISIVDIAGGKETNPLLLSKVSNEAFAKALEVSLENNGYLSADGKYGLDAELLGLEQPVFGFDFTVDSIVNYNLTTKKGNSVVFKDTIKSKGTATVGDSLLGVERLKMANEKSVQNNIKDFLKTLALMK